MTELKFVMPINAYKEDAAKKIQKLFDGFVCNWYIDEIGDVSFDISLDIQKHKEDTFEDCLKYRKELLEKDPNNESLRKEYEYYRLRDENDWRFECVVSFCCVLPVFTLENPELFCLDTDVDEQKRYEWHEFYTFDLNKIIKAIVMAIVISSPEVNIHCARFQTFVDGSLFRDELQMLYALQNEAYSEHQPLFSTCLSLQETFDWIKANSSLCVETEKPVVAISTLSYVLNRDIHEGLIYSIIGLESLHVPEDMGVTNLLAKRLSCVFPGVSMQSIRAMYRMRSKFVHGEMIMDVFSVIREESTEQEEKVDAVALLAVALLIESMRKLVKHNSKRFNYTEQISFSYIS